MPNANSLKNLEKGKATRFKTGDKSASNAGKVGGKVSQKVQKEKRDAATYARLVLSLSPEMPDPVEKHIRQLGIKTKKPDAKLISICAQVRKAMAGDQKALEYLLLLTGDDVPAIGQKAEPTVESMDDRWIRNKLDSMSDDQLRSYQEICTMFTADDGERDDDE